jgi:hypothetical protein
MVGIAETVPGLRCAALTLAGLFLADRDPQITVDFLTELLRSGTDPAADEFLAKYSPCLGCSVEMANGQVHFVPLGRDLAAVQVAALHQQRGDTDVALWAVEQLSDQPWTRLLRVRAEPYRRLGPWPGGSGDGGPRQRLRRR